MAAINTVMDIFLNSDRSRGGDERQPVFEFVCFSDTLNLECSLCCSILCNLTTAFAILSHTLLTKIALDMTQFGHNLGNFRSCNYYSSCISMYSRSHRGYIYETQMGILIPVTFAKWCGWAVHFLPTSLACITASGARTFHDAR